MGTRQRQSCHLLTVAGSCPPAGHAIAPSPLTKSMRPKVGKGLLTYPSCRLVDGLTRIYLAVGIVAGFQNHLASLVSFAAPLLKLKTPSAPVPLGMVRSHDLQYPVEHPMTASQIPEIRGPFIPQSNQFNDSRFPAQHRSPHPRIALTEKRGSGVKVRRAPVDRLVQRHYRLSNSKGHGAGALPNSRRPKTFRALSRHIELTEDDKDGRSYLADS